MTVSTRQAQIAYWAQKHPAEACVSLNHFLDEEWLQEAFRLTRRDGATGVDGITKQDYEQDLAANLRDLSDRARSGRYKAPPVKRGYVPKGDGEERRPIGMPAVEDKVLQRGVTMILEPLYEQDFLDCSYGFRPHRSAHDALETIWQNISRMGGCWILDVDIRKFFDTLGHQHLREILDQRIRDGVIRRLIDKWLKAGIWEDGQVSYSEQGTPQGGCISPMLSNIYLHTVLDEWFERTIKPLLRGKAFLVRFADDFVMGFAEETDARRVLAVLPKRFGKYGLAIHPDKTRLVDFRAPYKTPGKEPETFQFLGFTHYWGQSRRGTVVLKRKTAKQRVARTLKRLGEWCRRNRHLPLLFQQRKLNQKLRGHYAYFGITGNFRALWQVFQRTGRIWYTWLARRTRGGKGMNWERFASLAKIFPLALPRIVHSRA
ncbi:MAG: group II intron reverse transcriptase/maturase [Planctomycetota bacterium]